MKINYTVIVSEIRVIGYLWMPQVLAAHAYSLSDYDIENMRLDERTITRGSVEQWLCCHSGDFSQIIDFAVTIGDGEFDCDWKQEESEATYWNCVYPD